MKTEKVYVTNRQAGLELLAALQITDQDVRHEELPAVFVVRYPESEDEVGDVLARITLLDFQHPDYMAEIRRIIEWIGNTNVEDGIPLEQYPNVERAQRRLAWCMVQLGSLEADLRKVYDGKKFLRERMFSRFQLDARKREDMNTTDARNEARLRMDKYDDEQLAAEGDWRTCANLYQSVKDTLITLNTIAAKMRREWEYTHMVESA